jgi:serine protease AprX
MRNSVIVVRLWTALLVFALFVPSFTAQAALPADVASKLDSLATTQASLATGWSQIIVRARDAAALAQIVALVEQMGGKIGRALPIISGQVFQVPNVALAGLAKSPLVLHISKDRRMAASMERTSATVGATAVRNDLGYDGSGIGVAVIDSGITSWHDDLAEGGAQRVDAFVDFVNGRQTVYDDYGHGTHVAGIIAGNGFDSNGARTGIAPGVGLTVLKALDGTGSGYTSDVIAAMNYVLNNKNTHNTRVVNISAATGVYESYNTDPLTLAAKKLVQAGVVVVVSAGNNGKNSNGTQYGGVTAPANAPWVLTVGASSHMGTIDRADDTMAAFSSRGPSAIDTLAKPDIVAPGVGTQSLSDPNSAFYTTKAKYLLSGTVATSYLPYLSLSGTSMAAPVVAGTVALMLQANPSLTPNAVKAILQYTSQVYNYDALSQGAGFLNAKGAVELARYFAAPWGVYPASSTWSGRLIWANHLIRGGRLTPTANAWTTKLVWGAAKTPNGANVQWGVLSDGSSDAWGVTCANANCTTFEWGGSNSPNVVWGTMCGGADCASTWSASTMDTTALSTSSSDTVVWGSANADTVVWGSSSDDTVVWGATCSDPSCVPVLWDPLIK